jgi:hypothetical protein
MVDLKELTEPWNNGEIIYHWVMKYGDIPK